KTHGDDGEHATVELQVWDTASQERYSNINPMYIRGAHCVMFFFDVTRRETFDDLPDYIEGHVAKHLASYATIPKFLIGTKDDLREEKGQVDLDEARQFASEHGMTFIMTSS